MLGLTDKILENKTLMYSAVALAIIVACLLVLLMFRLTLGRRPRLSGGGRARQQRLGLVDAFNLDRQRQLIIVRRDNVEHMLMVGGPNDVLIESQIVRAEPAREMSRARDKEPDLRPALPLGLGAEPTAASIVAPPASIAPPTAVSTAPAPPAASAAEQPSRAASEATGAAPPPIDVDERAARVPQGGPRPVPPPQPVREAPSRAPLFPLPPRRPLPPLVKPLPSTEARVEPEPIAGPMARPDAPEAQIPRLGPLPPRAPSFLRPPAPRSTPRPAEPASEAPPIRDSSRDAAPALSTAPLVVAPPPSASPAAPAPAVPDAADPFDSIEEEMAKLLGRSSDKT